MDRREIWAQKHTKCCICQPFDTQAQNINHHLLEAMQNQLETDGIKNLGELEEGQHNVEFSQLIKMIYKKKFKSHQITKKCIHQNLKKKYMTELKCNERQFNSLTNFFSWKLAKYNFHVDTISQQCKTFTRHIISKENTNNRNQIERINLRQRFKEVNKQSGENSEREGKKINQNKDHQKSQKQNAQKSTKSTRDQKILIQIQEFQQKDKRKGSKNQSQKQKNIMGTIKPIQPQQFMEKQFHYPPYYYNNYPRPPMAFHHDPMYYYHQQQYRRIYDPAAYFMPTMMDFNQFNTTQEKQKDKNLNYNYNLKVENQLNYKKLGQGLDQKDNIKSTLQKNNKPH